MSNSALNGFCQGLLDKDGSLVVGDEDDFINDNRAVDNDKLKQYTAWQEAADERKTYAPYNFEAVLYMGADQVDCWG